MQLLHYSLQFQPIIEHDFNQYVWVRVMVTNLTMERKSYVVLLYGIQQISVVNLAGTVRNSWVNHVCAIFRFSQGLIWNITNNECVIDTLDAGQSWLQWYCCSFLGFFFSFFLGEGANKWLMYFILFCPLYRLCRVPIQLQIYNCCQCELEVFIETNPADNR